MKKRYDLNLFYELLASSFADAEYKTDFSNYFYNSIDKGKSKVSQKQIIDSKIYDNKWIKEIEKNYSSINKITNNIKAVLKSNSKVEIVEKAKRTNSKSIQHLAANSHLIKVVTPTVVPKKVLVTNPSLEFGTYENRFIMTLITKLINYTTNRIKIIEENLKSIKSITLNVDSNFDYQGEEIEVSINLKRIEEITKIKYEKLNNQTLEQANNLLRQLRRLENSQFMRTLKGEKPVIPPIIKTQVILKNADFRNAYNLWVYLDQNNTLDFEVESENRQKRFTNNYRRNLTQNILHLFSTVIYNDKSLTINIDSSYYKSRNAKYKSVLRRNVDLDFNEKKNSQQIEDYSVNEFLLKEMSSMFETNIDESISEGSSNIVSKRKAMKDLYDLVDDIFKSKYELELELESKESLENDIKTTFDKFRTIQMIREVKEQEYKNSVIEEDHWFKRLNKLNNDLINENSEHSNITNTKLINSINDKFNNESLRLRKSTNEKIKKELMKHRRQMVIFKKKETEKQKARIERINIREKNRLDKELEKLKKRNELEIKRNLIKVEKNKEILRTKNIKDKEAIRKKNKDKLEKL